TAYKQSGFKREKQKYVLLGNQEKPLRSLPPGMRKEIADNPGVNIHTYKIGTETIVYKKNGKKIIKKHAVRFRDPPRPRQRFYNAYRGFNRYLWPYHALTSQQVFAGDFGPVKVPPGHYFAMGDNRDNSADSRVFGCVPKYAIKGTLMFRIYPPDRFLIDQ
ncbi:MAG TPA: signal peptidase I, partial [Spirochaetota bacterium]|nr:signal peptidase I [Spirochaetota bacterium]